MICEICGGKGWIEAAKVFTIDTGVDANGVHRNPVLGQFATVPCFVCALVPF